MPAQPKIRDLEDALIAVVENDSAIKAYGRTFATVSSDNIQEEELGNQRVIALPPAFLFFYEEGALRAVDTITRKTYDYAMNFRILAYNRNLRGPAEEKKGIATLGEIGVYDMLDDLKRVLGGARLAVPGVSSQPQVELLAERFDSMSADGTVLSLAVRVHTEFQGE